MKYGKSPIVVYLQRACIIVLVCLCTFFATVSISAGGESFWKLTKEAYMVLVENVETFFGKSSIIITTNYRKYDSLEQMIENENMNNILLPDNSDNEYSFSGISFSDFGKEKMISFDFQSESKKTGMINITTSYNANFSEEVLVDVGKYRVNESHYEDIYQFEFDYGENHYLINSNDYDTLIDIMERLIISE